MDIEPEKVLLFVKEKKHAQNLLRNDRNKVIVNTEGAYYYIDSRGKYILLQGLLPRLKSVYWPNSNYYKLRKGIKREKGITKSRAAKTRLAKARAARPTGGGLARGTKIHRELKHFLQLDKKNFKKLHHSLHDFSARILKVIIGKMQLKPFLPEFDIFDEVMGVGTSIDMICLDKDGFLVLLEFKTGYKDYFNSPDGYMSLSLHGLKNTAQNQATLQLSSAALILEKKYGIPLERMKLYIIRVDDESLDIIPVEREFLKKVGPFIYQDLLSINTSSSLS